MSWYFLLPSQHACVREIVCVRVCLCFASHLNRASHSLFVASVLCDFLVKIMQKNISIASVCATWCQNLFGSSREHIKFVRTLFPLFAAVDVLTFAENVPCNNSIQYQYTPYIQRHTLLSPQSQYILF